MKGDLQKINRVQPVSIICLVSKLAYAFCWPWQCQLHKSPSLIAWRIVFHLQNSCQRTHSNMYLSVFGTEKERQIHQYPVQYFLSLNIHVKFVQIARLSPTAKPKFKPQFYWFVLRILSHYAFPLELAHILVNRLRTFWFQCFLKMLFELVEKRSQFPSVIMLVTIFWW